MKHLFAIIFMMCVLGAKAQKVDSIFFNLYTDSLKKGVHNYINVDGKLSNAQFFPLTSNEVILSSSAGRWDGNSLIIDSCYNKDSVEIIAVLKERPAVKKRIIIYIKQTDTDAELVSEKELIEGWRKDAKKKKKG